MLVAYFDHAMRMHRAGLVPVTYARFVRMTTKMGV